MADSQVSQPFQEFASAYPPVDAMRLMLDVQPNGKAYQANDFPPVPTIVAPPLTDTLPDL
jgi:hypothetical protein